MFSPQKLHISFSHHSGTNFDLDLIKDGQSHYTVNLNGMTYAVLGDEKTLKAACEILNSVSLDSIYNADDLKERLKDLSFLSGKKTDDICAKILNKKQKLHAWKKNEDENLDKSKKILAGIFWNNRENTKILEGLRKFFDKEPLDQALNSNDFEQLLTLFNELSADKYWALRTSSNYHPLGYVKTEAYEITQDDLLNLKNYLDDIGFSGVVSLSDAKRAYTIAPSGQESLENASFSMNSIAKVFTGTLALMTMTPSELKSKIALSPLILSFLEKEKDAVFHHLQIPSLLQTMHHDGGFGDYLQEYEKAVAKCIENNKTLPIIDRPEDLLKYAETTIYPLDRQIYSNLRVLLVGLAVQYKCNDKPYDQLLKELILTPADMTITKSKPQGGRFNETDTTKGMIEASPSGGYWTTSKDLLKFGKWLQEKCKPSDEGEKSEFLSNLELYGREFYVLDDEEIHHNGCSSSGSSCLSSFLKSGITIAVLSDQGNFLADRIHYTIREKMIEKGR